MQVYTSLDLFHSVISSERLQCAGVTGGTCFCAIYVVGMLIVQQLVHCCSFSSNLSTSTFFGVALWFSLLQTCAHLLLLLHHRCFSYQGDMPFKPNTEWLISFTFFVISTFRNNACILASTSGGHCGRTGGVHSSCNEAAPCWDRYGVSSPSLVA